jgi:hypothetical protein
MTFEIPDSVRTFSALPDIHYADLFSLPTTVTASPERWGRAMFGDTPSLGEVLIWRGVLGLRLSRGPSPDTVAGWRIGGRADGWMRLETASPLLRANLVVLVEAGQVSLATFLYYERDLGRVVWTPSSLVHRALVPRVLRSAAASLLRHR